MCLTKPSKTRGLTGMGPGLAPQEASGPTFGQFWNRTELFFWSKPGPLAGNPDLLLTLAETDTNTEVHQLNLPTNDRPGQLVTYWIARIRLFNLDGRHFSGRLNEGSDGLSWWPWGEEKPEPEEEDNLEQTIEASLRGIGMQRGPQWMRLERAFKSFVGLTLPEEYQGRWKEKCECLGNLIRPEQKTTNTMPQCPPEATKYLSWNWILYRRGKSNEPPAAVLVSAEQKRKAMEAAHELSGHCGREGTFQGSGAVLVARNVCLCQRLGENMRAMRE